jgi:colicin import membrane protein
MPGFVREHSRPLAGAVGLHLLLFALIAATAWRWTSSHPPVPMAIEGVVVDERALPSEGTTPRPKPAAPPVPEPEPSAPEPVAATPPPAVPDPAIERERERLRREESARDAREKAALEQRQAQEAERARQKAAAEEAARKKAADEAAQKKTADDAAKRKEAAEQQAREAELRRRLAAEEEAAAVAGSGVTDQYRAELVQAIERSWLRPESARPGLECTLFVTQAPGGTVLDVKLGPCNGDSAVKESITNAVFRASPLPAPADPRAFERRLEIVFKPME